MNTKVNQDESYEEFLYRVALEYVSLTSNEQGREIAKKRLGYFRDLWKASKEASERFAKRRDKHRVKVLADEKWRDESKSPGPQYKWNDGGEDRLCLRSFACSRERESYENFCRRRDELRPEWIRARGYWDLREPDPWPPDPLILFDLNDSNGPVWALLDLEQVRVPEDVELVFYYAMLATLKAVELPTAYEQLHDMWPPELIEEAKRDFRDSFGKSQMPTGVWQEPEKRKRIELALVQVESDLVESAKKEITRQQPWDDDAPEYLPLTEARKLIDDRFSLQTLGRLCKPDGRIRYMRKGQRRKVHVADFLQYMKGQQSDPDWSAAYMNWLQGQKAGRTRLFWKCQNAACANEYPEDANATDRCPKCKGQSALTLRPAPKSRR